MGNRGFVPLRRTVEGRPPKSRRQARNHDGKRPTSSRDRRFPQYVYRQGTEPDARFSLANERTFLAWIRTSLALLAGGVALETLGLGLHPVFRLFASVLLIVVGIMTPVQTWVGWMRAERALRLDTPLPSAKHALPLGIAVVVAGILVLLGVVFA